MGSDASRRGGGIGGHIGTFTSFRDVVEVGLNNFSRGSYGGGRGDGVWMQGHAAPGAYSRAFLGGRLCIEQVMNFRRESVGGGLSSYPRPRLTPVLWETRRRPRTGSGRWTPSSRTTARRGRATGSPSAWTRPGA